MIMKLTYILIIVSGFTLSAAENTKSIFHLKLADDEIVTLNEQQKDILTHYSLPLYHSDNDCEKTACLEFPYVSGLAFKNILKVMEIATIQEAPKAQNVKAKIKELQLSDSDLLSFITAANLLAIKPLLSSATHIIADKILNGAYDTDYRVFYEDGKNNKKLYFDWLQQDIKHEVAAHFKDFIISTLIPMAQKPSKKLLHKDIDNKRFYFETEGAYALIYSHDQTLIAHNLLKKTKKIIKPQFLPSQNETKIIQYPIDDGSIIYEVMSGDHSVDIGFPNDNSMVIPKDEQTIIIISDDNQVTKEDYSMYNGYKIAELSQNGRYMMMKGKNGKIVVDRYKENKDIVLESSTIKLSFSHDNCFLLANNTSQKQITLYDLQENNQQTHIFYEGILHDCMITQDHSCVAVVSAVNREIPDMVIMYDRASGEKITELTELKDMNEGSRFASQGSTMRALNKEKDAKHACNNLYLYEWPLPCSVFKELTFDQLAYLIIAQRNKDLYYSQTPALESLRENLPDLVIKTINEGTASKPYTDNHCVL